MRSCIRPPATVASAMSRASGRCTGAVSSNVTASPESVARWPVRISLAPDPMLCRSSRTVPATPGGFGSIPTSRRKARVLTGGIRSRR